ncbi:MAG: MFS transporter [Clostridia bacterium]|nr:MFS transporter [Clostridia bacterium]
MSDNNKSSIIDKAKSLFTEIKTHWDTPAEGKYVPYKEYKDIVFAVGSNYAGSKTLEFITFASSCYLIMHHYKLPYLTFSVINIINMPLNYISQLIWWFVCDNLGFLPKKTERKLNIVYIAMMIFGLATIFFDFSALFDQTSAFIKYLNGLEGMTAASCFKVFGTHFLYTGWVGARNIFWRKKLLPKYGRYKYSLYSDVIPKCVMVFLIGWLPVYNVPDVATRVWMANLLFACFNVFGFANNLEICTKSISPNLQERILVRSYPIKISHIFNSILAIILPVIIGALRYEWADINVYRFVIPITFTAAAAITMFFAGRVKERIPQPPIEKKVQIKFWDGMFGVLKNKYLLINNVVGLIDSLGNGMLPFVTILYFYTFRLSGLPYSLIVALISFAGTPPDLLSPYFLKRFSYKQIMIFYQLSRAIGNAAIVLAIIFCGENLVLCGTICVVVLFFMEMTKTVPTTAGHDMNVRIADYQMYLSGERLESFAGVYGWFTGPIVSFVGLIIPVLLLQYGFNSNWDVLFIDASRRSIIAIPLIIDVIGFLLMTIPYFFWDYDSKKQNMVMEVLKRRAEVTEKKAQEEGVEVSGGYKG